MSFRHASLTNRRYYQLSYRGIKKERWILSNELVQHLKPDISTSFPCNENGRDRTYSLQFRRLTCYPVTLRSQAEREGIEPTVNLHSRLRRQTAYLTNSDLSVMGWVGFEPTWHRGIRFTDGFLRPDLDTNPFL